MEECELWQARPDLIEEYMDGECVLLDRRHNRLHRLNAVASLIWGALSEPVSVRDLVGRLQQEYEVTELAAARDVERLLQEFAAADLIVVTTGMG